MALIFFGIFLITAKHLQSIHGKRKVWNRSIILRLLEKSWISHKSIKSLGPKKKPGLTKRVMYTLFEIFIFCPKIHFWFPEKIVDFFWVKKSWKCCGFGLYSCWQLWFHEKNCQKKFGWKTRQNVGVLSKLNFWTKIWLFE